MKKIVLVGLSLACLTCGTVALAATSGGLGGMFAQLQGSLSPLAKLITGAAYVAGLAFAVGAIVKFKAHKDNPTQIPIGTPIALLFVGAALIFLPSLVISLGQSGFGATAISTGASGGMSGGPAETESAGGGAAKGPS